MLLARRRISAVQLAKLMGVSQPYLSRRLNGAVAFDLQDLEQIAVALDLNVLDLINGAGAGLKKTKASAHQTTRKRDDHPTITGPIMNSRRDPTRPKTADAPNRRRPVAKRPPARPMAA